MTENEHRNVPLRRGRRPGTSSSRQAILDAARARFAEDGYAMTTIRKIATDAGVNPALIMQFFGSKEDLQLATIGSAVFSCPFAAASASRLTCCTPLAEA